VGWGDQEQGERRIDDFVMMEQFYFLLSSGNAVLLFIIRFPQGK
jgi:hypothetical protein